MPEMLNMAPLSDHDMLSQGKGPYSATKTGSTQTGVQNQDVLESDAQTDEVGGWEQACQAGAGAQLGTVQVICTLQEWASAT